MEERYESRITLLRSNYEEQMQVYQQQIEAKLAEFKREADMRHDASDQRHDASDQRHDEAARERAELRAQLARQQAAMAASFQQAAQAAQAAQASARNEIRAMDKKNVTAAKQEVKKGIDQLKAEMAKEARSAVQEELQGPRRRTAQPPATPPPCPDIAMWSPHPLTQPL